MFYKIMTAMAVALMCATEATAAPLVARLPRPVLNAPSDGRWYHDRDFSHDIALARGKLLKMHAGYSLRSERQVIFVRGRKRVTRRTVLADVNVLLALKRHNDGIIVVKISQNGENRRGFVVDWTRTNGVNTNFVVSKPDGYTLLAIKRVVRSGKGYREVVYTPFTGDIDTPTMRKLGLAYLRDTLDRAYTGLLNDNVRSQGFPRQRAAAVIPVRTALALSIIEHIDPSRLARERIENLVDEVLVTVAANRRVAYDYAVSQTGARGLFQFMPGTYRRVARMYPRAKLMSDFVSGMNNHENAAKATLLLFDADLARLPHARRAWIVAPKTDPHYAAVYLAAAYNGGAPRVVGAIAKGGAWTKELRPQTRLYIIKLDLVRKALRL